MNNNRYTPCYGCPDRKAGCHGKCHKYQEYTELNALEREQRNVMISGYPDQVNLFKTRIGNKKVKVKKNT